MKRNIVVIGEALRRCMNQTPTAIPCTARTSLTKTSTVSALISTISWYRGTSGLAAAPRRLVRDVVVDERGGMEVLDGGRGRDRAPHVAADRHAGGQADELNEGVSFKYSDKAEENALSDIDLRIESGSTLGIVGGTGSAKTSLIQLICRLYDVSEGVVTVGGRDVRDYDLQSLRDAVSVVLQKNVLFSGTIKDNMRWGNPEATDEQIVRACELAQADEFIQQLPGGYDYVIARGGTNVSGGQKQRLCIARALLKNPKVLILDDSTSAVDTRTDVLIRNAFETEIPGTTTIIIAQRLTSVEHADQIIVLDDGRIKERGTHAELMAAGGEYREIYDSQNAAKESEVA